MKPLPLGAGISFFQEMYLGYFTRGTSANYSSIFTNGVCAGIEAYGVKASAGYAGKWHDYHTNLYFKDISLSESFQFMISTDGALFGMNDIRSQGQNRLQGILVSGGYSNCTQVGRMEKTELLGAAIQFMQPALWTVEADFYVSGNSALVATFGYGHMKETLKYPSAPGRSWKYEEDIETIALESGFRYHPIDVFHTLFLQASLGIIRLNPVDVYTGQRHFYHTYDNLVLGCVIPVGATGLTVIPKAGFKTIFMDDLLNSTNLCGYSQYEIGVNIGCML
jgi:hypothetical protein